MAGLRGLRSLFVAAERAPSLVCDLDAGETLQLMFLLGRYGLGTSTRSKPLAFGLSHPLEAAAVLDHGWQACCAWPKSFHGYLSHIRERERGKRGRYGLAREFGLVSNALMRLAQTRHGRVAKEEMDAFVAGIGELPTRSRAVKRRRADHPSPDRCITITEAAERLQVRYEALRPFVERHSLLISGDGGKGAPLLLRERDVAQLKADQGELLDQQTAARHLGISKRSFIRLRDAKLLPAPATFRATELRTGFAWLRSDLDSLLARLRGGDPLPSPRKRTLSFAEVCRLLSPVGGGSDTVVSAILDGALRPRFALTGKRGIASLRFCPVEVDAWWQSVAAGVRKTLSVDQTAALLEVKQEVAYYWVRQGLIATARIEHSRIERGCRISQEEVEAFKKRYVTASELRKDGRFGHSRKLALTLIAKGLQPVSGPDIDAGRQYLFLRKDLRELLAS